MIPEAYVTEWANRVFWPTREQVEQDLLLSRLMVEIAEDPYLGTELLLRGGTCLHKLHLPRALRLSEDLDYVRRSPGGIGPLMNAVGAIGHRLGMTVRTRIARYPKIFFSAPFESGAGRMKVKIEVNTYERESARPAVDHSFRVDSSWFERVTSIPTFVLPEILATKLRALYQRSKGRDLFDLFVGLSQAGAAPEEVVSCFDRYRPDGYSRARAEANLRAKAETSSFRDDLHPLVADWPPGYSVDAAVELVVEQLFAPM